MNSRSFFAELKRRNVYKVAIAYAVSGWAIAEGISQIFPLFDVPNWALRLIVLLIVVGFPFALIIAWAFEITPEGIKRTEAADAEHLPERTRKRVWLYVVVIGALVAIGLFFLGRYTARAPGPASAELQRGEQTGIPEKSIAVLPFDNLSRDPDNAYFAEGIKEEVLARLSKVADLKVISIRSTPQPKNSLTDLSQIAQKLGVGTFLEGSVQRSGDKVRVTVQLVKAETDAHLWADTFDRKLTDIFAVETEIAKAVADTLKAKLTGSEERAISAKPTANLEAHQFYLRGRYYWNRRTAGGLTRALEQF